MAWIGFDPPTHRRLELRVKGDWSREHALLLSYFLACLVWVNTGCWRATSLCGAWCPA